MNVTTTRLFGSAEWATWALAVVVGTGAAGLTAMALSASLVWVVLVFFGLTVFMGSLVVRDAKIYWLMVFVAAIPFKMTKMFVFTPETVDNLRRAYGIYYLENIVPLLFLFDIPMIVLLMIWLSEVLTKRRRIVVPKPFFFMVGFVLWCSVTLLEARAPEFALTWIFFQVKMLILFVWFMNAGLGKKAIRALVTVMVAGLAFQGAICIYVYFTQTGSSNILASLIADPMRGQSLSVARNAAAYVYETGTLLRGTGTVGIANHQAQYFVMVLPLAFVGILFAERNWQRALSLLAFGLGVAGLYFTFSRGGLLTALGSLTILPLLMSRRGFIEKKHLVVLIVLGVCALGLASPILYEHITTRPGFFETRIRHMQYGLQMAVSRPLFGVGINNFNVSMSADAFGGIFSHMPIHNHYLRISLETGLIGLALYLAFYFWVARSAYRAIAIEDRFLSATSMALFASLIGIFAYWMDDLFYAVVIRAQLWVVIGTAVLIHQIHVSGPSAPPEEASP